MFYQSGSGWASVFDRGFERWGGDAGCIGGDVGCIGGDAGCIGGDAGCIGSDVATILISS